MSKRKSRPTHKDSESSEFSGNDEISDSEVKILHSSSISTIKREAAEKKMKKGDFRDKGPEIKPETKPEPSPVAKRGQTFSEAEIKTLLYAIFRGYDNNKAADYYLESHKGTGRQKTTLKGKIYDFFDSNFKSNVLGKIQSLRNELASKLGKDVLEVGSQKDCLHAHDFLMPWFVHLHGKSYYLQKKSNWKELKIGIADKKIRFHYVMESKLKDGEETELDWPEADIEAKNFLFYDFEVFFCSLWLLFIILLHKNID